MVVAVFSGSLGSRTINNAVRQLLPIWRDRDDVVIRHVIGTRDWDELGEPPELPPGGLQYQAVRYENRMELMLAAADVAVTRAGGNTVAELAVVGLPAVLVPLPIAPRDHQTANAAVLMRAGRSDPRARPGAERGAPGPGARPAAGRSCRVWPRWPTRCRPWPTVTPLIVSPGWWRNTPVPDQPVPPVTPIEAEHPVDLRSPRSIHVVGVGGAGMSAIASVLAAMGHRVSGSDLKESAGLERLRAEGVEVAHRTQPRQPARRSRLRDDLDRDTRTEPRSRHRHANARCPCCAGPTCSPPSRPRDERSPWPARTGRPPRRRCSRWCSTRPTCTRRSSSVVT